MKQGNLVWRLLRRNISISQIIGYAAATLVGLTIVLTAIQLYRDATAPENNAEDTLVGRDYYIVQKRVEKSAAMMGKSVEFTQEEMADLAEQPWVTKVGSFTPSRFRVYAKLKMFGRGMGLDMFFESVPDDFLDISPEKWHFDPTDEAPDIPIIISKDYLALYNFGFAASQGLPQMSEKDIMAQPLEIRLTGNGEREVYAGHIVGFSSRLNTIAVPEAFMQWANAKFGDTDDEQFEKGISRVIVDVNSLGDPAIQKYLDDHSLEIAGDKDAQSKSAYFLSIMSLVVIVIGLIISMLAFGILMLSIYLLLQKNREKIHDLMMLGYSPRQTARYYYILVGVMNVSLLVLAAVAMLVLSKMWVKPFEAMGLQTTTTIPTLAIGALIMLIVTAVNVTAIRRIVKRNF